MSVCYLYSRDGSTKIQLDATENVTYSRNVTVTTNTVFDGSQISDHVIPDLPVVTFSGVCSFYKIRNRDRLDPDEFRKAVEELVDGYQLLRFYGTDDNAIPSITNCYITSFNCMRDTRYANALYVTISVQQLDISTSIAATTITTLKADATEGQLSDKSDSTTGTKTEIDPNSTVGLNIYNGALNLFGDE